MSSLSGPRAVWFWPPLCLHLLPFCRLMHVHAHTMTLTFRYEAIDPAAAPKKLGDVSMWSHTHGKSKVHTAPSQSCFLLWLHRVNHDPELLNSLLQGRATNPYSRWCSTPKCGCLCNTSVRRNYSQASKLTVGRLRTARPARSTDATLPHDRLMGSPCLSL
jgi:hypothetical protein